jgi:hypothetical protein
MAVLVLPFTVLLLYHYLHFEQLSNATRTLYKQCLNKCRTLTEHNLNKR